MRLTTVINAQLTLQKLNLRIFWSWSITSGIIVRMHHPCVAALSLVVCLAVVGCGDDQGGSVPLNSGAGAQSGSGGVGGSSIAGQSGNSGVSTGGAGQGGESGNGGGGTAGVGGQGANAGVGGTGGVGGSGGISGAAGQSGMGANSGTAGNSGGSATAGAAGVGGAGCDPDLCPDDGNPCTTAVCDSNDQCIQAVAPAGVICRPSIGGCDLAEVCDGTGTTCSTDLFDSACSCPENGPIAGYAEHDGLREIDASNFVLNDTNTWDTNSAYFDSLMLPYTAVESVSLNRTATNPSGSLNTFLHGMIDYTDGFLWASGDLNVTYWVPQAITGSSVANRYFLVVSWHYDETNIADDPNPPQATGDKGVRVSLADVTDPAATVMYRHLLLVQPDDTSAFGSVDIHAGGLAWYGNYLYVADTSKGVRVFDLTRIFSASTSTACSSQIGLVNGEYCAYGYSYGLPQIGAFSFPSGLSSSCRPKFSYLSLDETSNPPSLISGEYNNDTTTGIYSRLLRWPLDPSTHRLATGATGAVKAAGAWYAGNRNIQGANAINGKFFLNSTRYSGALFSGSVNQASTVYRASNSDWAWMPEGIHYAPQDTLWTVTEGHTNMPRLVFSARANQIP